MSAVLAIAGREIRERRFLLAVAVGLGLIPAAAFFWPGMAEQGNAELVAVFVGLAFPTAASLAVGASVMGRDMAEGRLGFYLSRPIAETSLWAGKFLGGCALVLLAFALTWLPFSIVSGAVWSWLANGRMPYPLVFGPLAMVFLMANAHVAASLYRSRSAWIAVDAALLVVAFFAYRSMLRHAVDAGAGEIVMGNMHQLFFGAALVAVAASGFQLVLGRAGAERGRWALSCSYWLGTGLHLLCLYGLSSWALGTTPAEVSGVSLYAELAPRGVGVIFRGNDPGRAGLEPLFAMDAASGAYARFAAERATLPVFSRDGRRAFWVAGAPELFSLDRPPALAVARFDGDRPAVHELPLSESGASYLLAVDGEARLALLVCRGGVAVVDTASGATLGGARLASLNPDVGEFLPDGRVRLVERSGTAIVVRDWNPRDSESVERVRVADAGHGLTLALRGDHALVSPDGRELLLLDVEKGTRTLLARTPPDRPAAPHLGVARRMGLAHGGLAVAFGNSVVLVTPEGEVGRRIDLDPDEFVTSLVEPGPNQIAVGFRRAGGSLTKVYDIETGSLIREEPGLRPAGNPWTKRLGDSPEPGSLGSRLYLTDDHALVELLANGKRRVVVPAVD